MADRPGSPVVDCADLFADLRGFSEATGFPDRTVNHGGDGPLME